MKSEHQEALQKAIREVNSLRRLSWTIIQVGHISKAIKELNAILEV